MFENVSSLIGEFKGVTLGRSITLKGI